LDNYSHDQVPALQKLVLFLRLIIQKRVNRNAMLGPGSKRNEANIHNSFGQLASMNEQLEILIPLPLERFAV